MKIPQPPPDMAKLVDSVLSGRPERFADIMHPRNRVSENKYLPWDKLRHLKPPAGLSREEWWLGTRLARDAACRKLSLTAKDGSSFQFSLPDDVLRALEEIGRDASGQISISEQVTNPTTRDRYIVTSLMEEAIRSSQLEGASTAHAVAKEMLRSGRPARNRDELMILNNFQAMRRVTELFEQEMTVEKICEIHKIATRGTLENPESAGKMQSPTEERVKVWDSYNNLLHAPPEAEEIPDRMQRLCEFANGHTEESYIHPVLRAITVHFMFSYNHPFEDGNGRTARALFYWSMLRQGYWLIEFLPISRILRGAPARYARSFLYTEQDSNDLTYFHLYQLEVIQRSISDLKRYLEKKMSDVRALQRSLASLGGEFNNRQVALLENAVKNESQIYTVKSHATSHNVTGETARQDLLYLEERDLLKRRKIGKAYAWTPQPRLSEKLSA